MPLALEGIRVIDFTQITVGPSCTQLLGDLGADVIKIERPGTGEIARPSRAYGFYKSESILFLSLNRNKRSLSVDLSQKEGKQLIYRLVEKSDVVVQNFRPGVMEKLGLGYATLKAYNPRLIYASASGYGLTGPYVDKPGQDMIAQSMGGIMTVTGNPGQPPTPVGAPIADYIGGLLLAEGITAALLARERTGLGQAVDVALLDTQLTLQHGYLTAIATLGELPPRRGRALYRVYQTSDGYITLAGAFHPRPLSLVCEALGLPDLGRDPRFDTSEKMDNVNAEELQAILEKAIAEKTTAECLQAFEARDILCGPVNTHQEVLADPQVQHNNMVVEVDHPRVGRFRTIGNPIRMSQTPWAVRLPPPALGQHNDEVLALLGYTEEEAAALKDQKVID